MSKVDEGHTPFLMEYQKSKSWLQCNDNKKNQILVFRSIFKMIKRLDIETVILNYTLVFLAVSELRLFPDE